VPSIRVITVSATLIDPAGADREDSTPGFINDRLVDEFGEILNIGGVVE
jgi:hypothetical protein